LHKTDETTQAWDCGNGLKCHLTLAMHGHGFDVRLTKDDGHFSVHLCIATQKAKPLLSHVFHSAGILKSHAAHNEHFFIERTVLGKN